MGKPIDLPKWDRNLYPSNSEHHRDKDDWFFSQCPELLGDERVLDLGCGSGEFTTKLASRVPRGSVVGLDASKSLIAHARSLQVARTTFVEARIQDARNILDGEQFEAIISRSALHWVPEQDHPGILAAVSGLMNQAGWAQFEFGGAGNIPRMYDLLNDVSQRHGGVTHPWFFPDAGRYLEFCEEAGLDAEVRTVAQRRSFTKEGAIGWMHSQALQAYESSLGERFGEFSAEAEQRIDEIRRSDGSYDLTYVRLLATLRKQVL